MKVRTGFKKKKTHKIQTKDKKKVNNFKTVNTTGLSTQLQERYTVTVTDRGGTTGTTK